MLTLACLLRTLSTHSRLWLQTISADVNHFAAITFSSAAVAASAFSAMSAANAEDIQKNKALEELRRVASVVWDWFETVWRRFGDVL